VNPDTHVEGVRPGASLQAATRLMTRPAFWVVLVLAVFGWRVASVVFSSAPKPLPTLIQLPAFSLVDQEGKAYGTKELQGHVWVGGFIFTRCVTICPAITAKMHRIQERTRDLTPTFHMVSFSVDPEYDTPEVLTAYAKEHLADPRQWTFLTGSETAMKQAVVDGMKIAMEKQVAADGEFLGVLHGGHLVLVDGKGQVRGYYDSEEEGAVNRIVRDAGLLVATGR
jgi:protein SCO1/2